MPRRWLPRRTRGRCRRRTRHELEQRHGSDEDHDRDSAQRASPGQRTRRRPTRASRPGPGPHGGCRRAAGAPEATHPHSTAPTVRGTSPETQPYHGVIGRTAWSHAVPISCGRGAPGCASRRRRERAAGTPRGRPGVPPHRADAVPRQGHVRMAESRAPGMVPKPSNRKLPMLQATIVESDRSPARSTCGCALTTSAAPPAPPPRRPVAGASWGPWRTHGRCGASRPPHPRGVRGRRTSARSCAGRAYARPLRWSRCRLPSRFGHSLLSRCASARSRKAIRRPLRVATPVPARPPGRPTSPHDRMPAREHSG